MKIFEVSLSKVFRHFIRRKKSLRLYVVTPIVDLPLILLNILNDSSPADAKNWQKSLESDFYTRVPLET